MSGEPRAAVRYLRRMRSVPIGDQLFPDDDMTGNNSTGHNLVGQISSVSYARAKYYTVLRTYGKGKYR